MSSSTPVFSMVGAPDTVRRGLEAFIENTGVDELMVTGQIYDHASRLRSFEIAAALRGEMTKEAPMTASR